MAQAKMTAKISALKREIREEGKAEGDSGEQSPAGGSASRGGSKRSPSSRLSAGFGGDDATEHDRCRHRGRQTMSTE